MLSEKKSLDRRDCISEIVERIKRLKPVKINLFGSYAWGGRTKIGIDELRIVLEQIVDDYSIEKSRSGLWKTLTIDDLDNLIEQNFLEILDDPDTSLDLREEFKEELKIRLAGRLKRIPHREVMKRFG